MRGIRSSRLVVCAALSLVTCWLVFGVAAATAGARRQSEPRAATILLKVGWTTPVDSLNPFVGFTAPDYEVWALNYDSLTRPVAATMDAGPDLATSWQVSPNGKTWTFHLRHGVKWQDGRPFRAADVAWTYTFIIKHKRPPSRCTSVASAKSRRRTRRRWSSPAPEPRPTCSASRIPILPKHIWSKMSASTLLTASRTGRRSSARVPSRW